MSLRLHNIQECPPGYFRYLVPETGRRFPDPKLDPGKHYLSLRDLTDALVRHYQANGLPVPGNLDVLVQDQLCRLLPPDRCYYDSPSQKPVQRFFVTFNQIVEGTKNLASWALKGKPKVGLEVMNSRAEVCVRCPLNVFPAGCATCNSPLTALVSAFVGQVKSSYDSAVHSCAVCGCSLKVLLQMPQETIQEHLSPEQKEMLPEYCWQKL